MTQQVDEPQVVSRRAEGIISVEREVSPPVAGPGRIEMPTHPAMPRLHTERLRFAPAPTGGAAPNGNAEQPTDPARRMDWMERVFEAGWVGLLVACAAECARCLL